MKIKILKHCDEAMTDACVVGFVNDIYLCSERKNWADHPRRRMPVSEPWIELEVGRFLGFCSARLCDKLGVLAEWDTKKRGFYAKKAPNERPYCLTVKPSEKADVR